MPSAPDSLIGSAASLDGLLRNRAEQHGQQTAYQFLGDGETLSETCTYRELDARARRIAGWLQENNFTGKPVLLVFPAGIDYAAAFFGCLYAGAIATPVNPPRRNRRQSRIEKVAANAGARCVLTNDAAHELASAIIGDSPPLRSLKWQSVDRIDSAAGEAWHEPGGSGNQPALLQYTSGSTGDPKGVVVSHENLLENQRLIGAAFGQDESIVVAGWLPIYHDMGLIGNILHPIYFGGQLVFMPPVAFLQKPIRWLRMISDYGATIAGGPDFAFDLCVRETSEQDRQGLDLSRWQVAFNGSEPLHAATLRQFSDAFKSYGFREQAFCPCFGMAETTLLVSGSRKTKLPLFAPAESVAPKTFLDHAAKNELVGCGPPDESLQIELVDPETRQPVAPGEVGEVWISGPTVAQGYWKQPELSQETFAAQIAGTDPRKYLRTGDLGVLYQGELFITGRLKDLIIVRGVNHYPQDIERTVAAAHESLQPGGAVAFPTLADGEEQLGLVVEVQRASVRSLASQEVFQAIRRAVAEQHELAPAGIALVRPGALPKTSSGKPQRRETRRMFESGQFKAIAEDAGGDPALPIEVDRRGDATPSQETNPRVLELQDWIVKRIAQRRELPVGSIDPNEPFARYGLDSLAAVRLSGELSDRLGRDVPPTLAYDCPTPAAVARYLVTGEAPRHAHLARRDERDEPLAVVGVGCRFPGGDGPSAYWKLLRDAGCAIGPLPRDRWPAAAGEIGYPDFGGYLPAIDRFDPAFFKINAREADQMDPQQRLLLEVAWETLEHAGARPDQLRGQPVGVFVGVSSGDYSRLQAELGAKPDPYSATGGSLAVIANRLSYTLDFRGPSWSVDTACSSSLVAVHQAAEAIRRGDCETALAGGVNLIVSDSPIVSLDGAGMLSAAGLCRAFCRGGDGFVRGEGCGLLLLKRLSRALSDGDRVLCVLRGTAVNQDGRSNGLTAPNGPAQQAVIRRALSASGLKPNDIDYLEAHGTGTELGDPTEMGALAAVFGKDRDRPLQVGSAKTNVGHLEGAAGVAGLIKACLSLAQQELPPHPLFDPASDGPNGPSPHIDWSQPIAIPTERTPWRREAGRVRRAGVSSFGFGGTNAHVIVEEAPAEALGAEALAGEAGGEEQPAWVTLSARTPAALGALAERYAAELPAAPLGSIAWAANTGRSAHAERLAVEAKSREQLMERLKHWAEEPDAPSRHTARGEARGAASSGWLFGGQGGCRPGMGKELYARWETFRNAWDACDRVLTEQWPRSLATICWDEPQERLAGVDAQVALVAWQLSLSELWKSWLGEPAWVCGHSLGEYAAAVTAGMLERDEALRLVCRRAELLDSISDRGGMLAVMAGSDRVAPFLKEDLSIAAENGPRQTVVSGPLAALESLSVELKADRIRSQQLATSHAFHSRLVEPAMEELTHAAQQVEHHAPRLGFLSTLTGEAVESPLAGDYWARQLREPVRFSRAISAAPSEGLRLEFSPTPVLRSLVEGEVHAAAGYREQEEAAAAEAAAARLWTAGAAIDFRQVHPPQRLSVSLPTYPFERRRHWFTPGVKRQAATAGELVHPLLGRKLDLAGEALVFETDLSEHAWLADHRLLGKPTLPAVGYLELAWAAGRQIDAEQAWSVEDLLLERPLNWEAEAGTAVRVQTVVTPDGDRWRVEVLRREPDGWSRVAHCRLTAEAAEDRPHERETGKHDLTERDVAEHYATCRRVGLDYGPAFQAVRRLSGAPGRATATIELPATAPSDGYLLPPPLADAALQAIAAAMPQAWNLTWVPKAIQKAKLKGKGDTGKGLFVHLRLDDDAELTSAPPRELKAAIHLSDDQGRVVAELHGVRLAKLAGPALKQYFRTAWRPQLRTQEIDAPPALLATEIATTLRNRAESIAEQSGASGHLELLQGLEQLSGRYAARALVRMGGDSFGTHGAEGGSEELAKALGVDPSKNRLFGRLLDILAEEGLLERTEDKWRVTQSPAPDALEEELRELHTQHPEGAPELALLERCGEKLVEVLRGEADPLSLLFPPEGGAAADLYRHSAGARALNSLAAEAVAEMIDRLPPGRGLRVLEIGAGTAATTERILQRVGVDRLRYTFTDVTPGFLAAARQRLPATDNLEYRVLDIEQDPIEQGMPVGGFDLVIAANVLHATADLAQSVNHARKLLAPGGQLLLIEGTRPTRWLDLTFGMTDGWWRFADSSLRADYPLISTEQWSALLEGNGFRETASVSPVEDGDGLAAENSVLLATADVEVEGPEESNGNDRCTLVGWNSEDVAPFESALQRLGVETCTVVLDSAAESETVADRLAGSRVDELIVLPPQNTSAVSSAAEAERLTCDLLAVLQAVVRPERGSSSPGRVTLVTRGAQAIGTETVDPAHAALWGFIRAASREDVRRDYRCIDLPATSVDPEALAGELLQRQSTEREVALRDAGRFVMRLADCSPSHQIEQARKLSIRERGSIDGLRLVTTPRVAPGRGEVQVRVAAAGVNFRDVLNVLGRYPGEPPLGAEVAGVVEAVGQGVSDLEPGDRVIAITADAFADFVTIPASSALLIPDGLSLDAAATIPVAYGTASLALEELTAIEQGTRVLVHAATGGVGLAALAIAADRGAEVFATASVGKQHVLRGMGLAGVYDSRSPDFADRVLADTDGSGVAVVLNALGEEFLEANLKALGEGGCLVDLTKPSEDLAARAADLRPDVAYHLVDLAAEWNEKPGRIRELLSPVLDRVAAGWLLPLPFKAIALDEASEAFRLMQRAGHVGKLLLKPTDQPPTQPLAKFREGEAVVVTGGFGDLGLLTAEWLAEQGAECIALVGRRQPSEGARQSIAALRETGAKVMTLEANIADRNQLADALKAVRETGVAIVGVVHSAGTLDDGLIAEQNAEKIANVFAAKVQGLGNLDELTAEDPLRLFAAYSSVASVLGAPGQANHSAANAFMDGLVARRRAEGQCGQVINWGPWAEIGEAARRGVDSRTDLGGIDLLSPEEGRQAIEALLPVVSISQRMVAPWDFGRLPDWLQTAPLLAELVSGQDQGAAGADSAFIKSYRAAPAFRRRDLLAEHLRNQLATVLGLSDAAAIAPTAAMFDLGLDSLTTLELKNSLRWSLGVDLPSNLVFDFPTIDRFADEVHRRLSGEEADPAFVQSPDGQSETSSALQEEQTAAPGLVEQPASVWDDLAALEAELETWDGSS